MNDHSYMNETNGSTAAGITLTGFLVGAIFGAGLALLMAPAAGGETRKKLGETARKLGEKASDAVSHLGRWRLCQRAARCGATSSSPAVAATVSWKAGDRTTSGRSRTSRITAQPRALAAARVANIPVFFTTYAFDPADPPSPQNRWK